MNDFTPDKVKNLLEMAINNSSAAWAAQSKYFDDLVKRNVTAFSTLSEARIESLKEIGESETFNQAFEANIAYEDSVREELKKMYEENMQAWEALQSELKTIYTASEDEEDAA